jgi:PAS domain S-box-containing protein
MNDSSKSKEQLIAELDELRRQVQKAEVREEQLLAAESALRESEVKYRSMFENATEGVYQTSADGKIVSANPALVQMLGYESEAELKKLDVAEDLYVSAEERSRYSRELREAGKMREMEITLKRKDGQQIVALDSARVIRDDQGDVVGYWGVLTDITGRKRDETERRRLDARVRDAQKLESLSILAGGVAHDFNNLLMGVLGNAELALLDIPEESRARESVEKIRTSALRAADLARQMLAFSGKGRFVVGSIGLSEVISEMEQLIKSSVSTDALIEYHLDVDMPAVSADVTQIRQLVLNLVSNACEALEKKGGLVVLSTGTLECTEEYLSSTEIGGSCSAGTYAFLEVSDTGTGMDEATVGKMFDPFFTTKFTGRGLGLAAVSGIVRGHHGAITVDSEPGKGTKVRVMLPVSTGRRSTPSAGVRKVEPGAGDGRIVLLVDDDASVLDVGTRMLETAGFRVITASDGHDALHAFEEHSTEIDCVVLDLTMPGMGGEDTFEELRRRQCTVPVILGSGYFHADLNAQFEDKGFAAVLQKPYRRDHLIATVATALKSAS